MAKSSKQSIVEGTEVEATSKVTAPRNELIDPLQAILDSVDEKIADVEAKIEEFNPVFAELENLQRKRREVSSMIDKLTGAKPPVVRAPAGANLQTITDLLSDGTARTIAQIMKATNINVGSVRATLVQNPETFSKNDNKQYSLARAARRAA